jgi:hypothetical protein
VGVGDENFQYMKTLENINEVKKHVKGEDLEHIREITQFVAFKDY